MSLFWLFLLCPIAYGIGNISFSFLITKLLLRKDLSNQGSGNLGATNVLRNYGFKVAIMVLLLDISKGVVPAVVGLVLFGVGKYDVLFGFGTQAGYTAAYACGLASFLGHCFPVWNKFKGGKGVATLTGVLMVVNPLVTVVAFLCCIAFGQALRCGALGSFFFMTGIILWQGFYVGAGLLASIFLATFYFAVLFMHRTNIYRLLRGTENKVSLIKKKHHIIEHEQLKQ